MELAGAKRPTGITITAWLWIVMGGLMILSALMGGFAYTTIGKMRPLLPPSTDMPAGSSVMNSIFQYFGLLLLLQGIVAVLAIWAGVSLLRLKQWARTTIEVLSWIALLYTVGFGIFWVYTWVAMTSQVPTHGAPVDPVSFRLMGAVMGVVVTAIFAVPLWIMIRYLRGAEVHMAITDAHQPNA
jgi:hypothetical protein